MTAIVLLLVGPEPQPARRARAGDLRHRHARRPRRRGPRPRPTRTASTLEHLQSNHEGELVDAIHGARGPVRRHRHQPRRVHPLRLGASTTRWPPSTARSSSCTCPTPTPARRGATPRWSRPVATGTDRGLRRRRLPAGGRAAVAELLEAADDRRRRARRRSRRWTSRARLDAAARPRSAGAGCRRAARHPPHQHPLPHRLHRLGRRCCWSPPTGRCSSPTAATREQAADQLGAAGRRRPTSRSGAPAPSSGDRRRRAAAGVGRARPRGRRTSRWAAAARATPTTGSPAPSWCPPTGLVEELRRVKDAGEVARIEAACAIADAALGRACARAARRARPRREFALELDTAMRRRGRRAAPASRPIVAAGPERRQARTTGPATAASSEGDLVVIDFGALVDGYRSDMTRTVAVGEPERRPSSGCCDVVRRRPGGRGRGGGRRASTRRGRRRGLPRGHRRRPAGATRSCTAPATAWASTSTRRRGWPTTSD